MLAIFGGAFNPPTIAHYKVAKHVLKLPEVTSLRFVPVGDHYQKAGLIPAFHRERMLEIMTSGLPNMSVSNIEIKAKHPLKTIETLEIIQNEYPKESIAFVMGADNLCGLTNWYKYEQLVKRFKLIIVNRGEFDVNHYIKMNFPFAIDSFVVACDFEKINISSSEYRGDLTKDEFLLVEVEKYIKKHGLYR